MNTFLIPITETCTYLLCVYGIYMLLSVLKFADISADNVFSFGSILGAFILFKSHNILFSLIGTFFGGFLIGSFTSLLYSVVKIPKLLAGIITYSMLFSINIKFFHLPNISIPDKLFHTDSALYIVCGIDIIIFFFLSFLYNTKLGKSLLTIGNNPGLLTEFGAPNKTILLIGVGLSNGLIATSGYLASLSYGFSDTSIGTGVLVNSVAGVILAERLMGYFNKKYRFLILFIGMLLYNLILYLIISYFSFGLLEFSDYKIISGLVIIFVFMANRKNAKDLISLQ